MDQTVNFKSENHHSKKFFKGLTLISCLLLSLILLLLSDTGMAQHHRHFTWTYETTTLGQGEVDVEPWITYSTGRTHFYNRYETRLEVESGITDRLQTAVYLNREHEATGITNKSGELVGLKRSSGYSFSNEWLWNVLNPSANPIGLGLYFEYGLSPSKVEIEPKILLEKRWKKHILAYNVVGEYEFEYEFEYNDEKGEIERNQEYIWENDLAYMYMINPKLGFGAEVRNHNEFVDGEWEHSALFGGPTLFYSNGKFFAMLNALPQITDLKGGGRTLHEHEKLQTRIILGVEL